MDLKVSQKEVRYQREGLTEVLVSDIFDLYPIFSPTNKNLIVDMEMLEDARTELLDRAMFSVVKQRGDDPINLNTGIQWEEAILGEVASATVMSQIQDAVRVEGTGVQVVFDTTTDAKGNSFLSVKVTLTDII